MAKTKTSGQGRPKGSLNKATAELKQIAGQYTEAAIRRLAELAGLVEGIAPSDNPGAQVAALRELLDRGHGKPAQAITGPDDGPLQIQIIKYTGE